MDPSRLKKVEDIYHAASERRSDEREAYLDKVCGEDAELRKEVVELLSFDDVPDSFIDNPPDDLAAEMFADELPENSLIGKTIGRYTIEELVGIGGMGEVYLAEDKQLKRKVALKLVPAHMIENVGRLKRFKHEAQAASALNHPNILTIHEFGSENGSDFIVSEFVDGVTLRKRMNAGAVALQDLLDISIQIASALGAAHNAGIVHRDIKPENVMIRRDGIVKVLDFGLAKLTPADAGNVAAGAEDPTLFKTEPGMVMGTVGYMSPEQARGVRVDARTDIWSLGVIIYEILVRHRPFEGDTQTDVLVAILNQPLPMTADATKDVPPELRRVIEKALEKNAADRYTSAVEMAADLTNYKQRLAIDAEIKRTENNRPTVDNRWPKGDKEPSIRAVDVREDSEVRSPQKQTFTAVRLLVLLAAVAALAAIGLFLFNRPAEQPVDQAAFPPVIKAADETPPARTLTYSLTVQSFTDGRYKDPFVLSGEMLFRNRDRIRINVKSPQAGYLYILNQGPRDIGGGTRYNILFPSPTANSGSSSLAVGQQIQIPQGSWFELDEKEGTEIVWLVWSTRELADLEAAKRYANPEDKGRINDQTLYNAVAALLESHDSKAAITRDDDNKETRVMGNSDIIVRAVRLEHH